MGTSTTRKEEGSSAASVRKKLENNQNHFILRERSKWGLQRGHVIYRHLLFERGTPTKEENGKGGREKVSEKRSSSLLS